MQVQRLALCGAGMISHAHSAAAAHLGIPVVAVASRTSERREERARQLRARPVAYEDLPAGADLVIVATPPGHHFDHTVHCLERGAGVLVEKPLVTTLNEADRLVMIAQRYGHRVHYGENLAYAPGVRRWISHIAEVGPLEHFSVRFEQSAPTWGDFLLPHWGGGVLFDLGVHPVALAVLSARAAHAGEVVAVTCTLRGDPVDEWAELTLILDSGLTISVMVSWIGPSTPQWTLQASSATEALVLELQPDVTLERSGEIVALPEPRTHPAMLDTLGYTDQLRACRADLEEARTPWMSVDFGRWILEIVCAAYVSAGREGARIAVPSGCDRFTTPLHLWRHAHAVGAEGLEPPTSSL
jgi:predicted dehydrogenase